MNEIPKLAGRGPLDPDPSTRGSIKPGSDRFQEMMKVGSSEKREQKKKKTKTESTEERKAEELSAASKRQSTQTTQITLDAELQQTYPANLIAPTSSKPPVVKQLEEQPPEHDPEVLTPQIEESFVEMKKECLSNNDRPSTPLHPSSPDGITPSPSPWFIAPATASPPGYALLRADILALFEKMVGFLSIMQENGTRETTLQLPNGESPFAGLQIVIREFDTAPSVYYIELLATSQNSALLERNIPNLLAAFQSGNHRFSVNRINVRLSGSKENKPLFHRKESPSSPN